MLLLLFCCAFLVSCQDCNDLGYPLQYVVYKLQTHEKITFDGKIDEPAWQAVPWTSKFQDIQGPSKPTPYFETRVKMRYDHKFLYIAGHMEEPNVWANNTINNSVIFTDNDFEVFIDTDGSNIFYKELELNARNLNWNLILCRTYMNGGPPVCNYTQPGECAESAPQYGVPYWDIAPWLPSGVYVDGAINNPVIGSKYWSIEIGIPIEEYIRYTTSKPPRHGDYWRIDFSRVEWHIKIVDKNGVKVYEKDTSRSEENWVWQPTYWNPPDMHVPETWGYIQFSEQRVNATAIRKDPTWPQRDALMKVYYALVNYYTKYNKYTSDLQQLVTNGGLPAYVAKGACAAVPTIDLSPTEPRFTVHVGNGNVRDDRFLWFSH